MLEPQEVWQSWAISVEWKRVLQMPSAMIVRENILYFFIMLKSEKK